MSPLIFQGHAAKTTQIFGLRSAMSSNPAAKLSVKPTSDLDNWHTNGIASSNRSCYYALAAIKLEQAVKAAVNNVTAK